MAETHLDPLEELKHSPRPSSCNGEGKRRGERKNVRREVREKGRKGDGKEEGREGRPG